MTTAAWQHIYSNVEKEQSPHRRGGFQTLFYSKAGLSEAEVQEVEARLLYFPCEGQPVKRVFFHTSTGKPVLAQVVHLPESDEVGRGGRYLAHAFIFPPEVATVVAAALSSIFQTTHFVTTIAEALRLGDMRTGDIPPTTLPLTDDARYRVTEAQRWHPDHLKRLTLLALRAEGLRRERRTLAVIGSPEDALRTLSAALLAVPPTAAALCSFDTYFDHCNPIALYYWAVGLQAETADPRFIAVDARCRKVLGQIPDTPATAYERWALACIASGNLTALAAHKQLAFNLCEWLEGRRSTPPPVAAEEQELVLSVFGLNSPHVRERLRSRLVQRLSPALAERVFPRLCPRMASPDLLAQLRRGLNSHTLLDELYAAYAAERFSAPSRIEIQELRQALTHSDHRGLRLLLASWLGDKERVRKELSRADDAEYPRLVEVALQAGTADPEALLVPGRAEAFLDAYFPAVSPQKVELVPLTQALLRHGEHSSLPRLATLVPGRPAKELRRLAKLLRGLPGEARALQRGVDQALANLPPSPGLLGPLRRLFRPAHEATGRSGSGAPGRRRRT